MLIYIRSPGMNQQEKLQTVYLQNIVCCSCRFWYRLAQPVPQNSACVELIRQSRLWHKYRTCPKTHVWVCVERHNSRASANLEQNILSVTTSSLSASGFAQSLGYLPVSTWNNTAGLARLFLHDASRTIVDSDLELHCSIAFSVLPG